MGTTGKGLGIRSRGQGFDERTAMTDHDSAVVAAAMSAMEKYTGVVPGYRRAHSRGHGFVGYFEATAAVGELTVAEHMQGDQIPVVVRLSNGAGSPYAADLGSPRRGATLGLGVEFALPSGGRTTWGAPNMTAFPARTPEEFVAVTTAQRRDGRGRPNPLRLLAFVLRHPRTVPGLKELVGHPPIRSFAAADFHGLHAYYLVDAQGRRRAFRYHWMSTMEDDRTVTEQEAALWPPQFLVEEMRQRVARGPVGWDLKFQLAEDGDPTHDQLLAWPASRPTLHAGTLTLTDEHPDQDVIEGMVFDPTNVPAGVECSDDPLLTFRSKVYGASHAARTRETKPVSNLID
jgi:catalase